MKLYRSSNYPTRWYAHSRSTGWVMFPNEPNGWAKRQQARGIDPIYFRQVSGELALQAGFPVHSGSPDEHELQEEVYA